MKTIRFRFPEEKTCRLTMDGRHANHDRHEEDDSASIAKKSRSNKECWRIHTFTWISLVFFIGVCSGIHLRHDVRLVHSLSDSCLCLFLVREARLALEHVERAH